MPTGAVKKRVAVIGAGGSGLCSVKTCLEAGLDVVCFEKGDALGGLWVYRDTDQEGQPSVMKSTVINSSKEMSAFSDFPPPDHFPSFMHNGYMLQYLHMYAKHFGVESHVRLKHKVLKIIPAEDYETTGRWKLFIKNLETEKDYDEVFEGVMLCAGHHVFPITPSMPGLDSFQGQKMHSHSLKTAKGMEDKRVLIVGNGNSGVDVAVEASSVTNKVYLSTRRGFWLISRSAFGGAPIDALANRRCCFLIPYALAGFVMETIANLRVNHKNYNLKPKHSFLAQHPTLNDYLPAKILSGSVQIKGAIERFTEKGVIFAKEDKEVPLDAVVLATGYSYKIPFLDTKYAKVDDEEVKLYKLVFPPDLPHPSLAIIGIVQPMGAIFPISEMQARWFVEVLKGNCKLPSHDLMLQEIKTRQNFLSSSYLKAVRHLTEVLFIEFMDTVAEEIGAKPNLLKLLFTDPILACYSFFGPCTPYQFRLQGPHPWKGARQAILSFNKKTQTPLNTRKITEVDLGSKGIESLTLSGVLWGLAIIYLCMYILLTVL